MNGIIQQVNLLLRQWPVLLGGIVLGLIGAIGYSAAVTPVFTSTSQVLIAVSSSGSPGDRQQGAAYVVQTLPTYTSAVTSSVVLGPVIDELGLDDTVGELRESVTAVAEANAALITITAKASTAVEAQAIAAAVTDRFIAVAPALISPVASDLTADPSAQLVTAEVKLSILDEATLPLGRDSPTLVMTVALGFVAGLLIGVGVALTRNVLDTRVRSEEEIITIVGSPVIARLPDVEGTNWESRDNDPVWSDAVRTLRSAMSSWVSAGGPVQFSSATDGEGTTATVTALAASFAKSGLRTVTVDANLREPTLHNIFHVAPTPGLADLLNGVMELDRVLAPAPLLRDLTVVPAGLTDSPGDLVASGALELVLLELSRSSDIVLVDTPSIVSAADALEVARSVASVILVVAMGGVTRQVLTRAVEQIRRAGGAIDGIVITHAPLASLHVANSSAITGIRSS
ncbi:MAG: chromosome partitioning protein [Glaciihabitans sp.]|nr:chromosome partitioning protein [Glaciihabitans sp.]